MGPRVFWRLIHMEAMEAESVSWSDLHERLQYLSKLAEVAKVPHEAPAKLTPARLSALERRTVLESLECESWHRPISLWGSTTDQQHQPKDGETLRANQPGISLIQSYNLICLFSLFQILCIVLTVNEVVLCLHPPVMLSGSRCRSQIGSGSDALEPGCASRAKRIWACEAHLSAKD